MDARLALETLQVLVRHAWKAMAIWLAIRLCAKSVMMVSSRLERLLLVKTAQRDVLSALLPLFA